MSQDGRKLDAEERFDSSDAIANIRRSYGDLQGTELKVCLLSLSIFPENSVIRKRPLIYWWIGEGFITSTPDKTAEEIGEEIFEKLMRKVLIQPDSGESNCELLVKNCRIHPWIRRMLISLAREARLFNFDLRWPMMPSYSMSACRRACLVNDDPIPQGNGLDALLTVFNVNVQYLNLQQEWLEKLKRVEVLQLGRWQSSPEYHIEVDNQRIVGSQAVGFLNGLGTQKHLKYLSLRGISRIKQLPDSIRNLISLEILDLRACHDLERLPSDISLLKRLTHLDVAECYLLEGMPKGIQKLKSLQVLKGFLIGSKEKTTSKLGDLAGLKKLRRLSIHMGNEAAVKKGELKKLQEISSLRHLKISWGAVSDDLKAFSEELLFPSDLEKLDLQGIPLKEVPEGLKPSKLKKLKKLYIMGGNLASLDQMHEKNNVQWKVEILRLHFLKRLTTEPAKVKEIFPHLNYWAIDMFDKSDVMANVRRSYEDVQEVILDKSDVMANIRRSYGDLQGTELKVCLLSLSIFPENSVIRKRPLIYWWIGEGFITSTPDKTAEEIGEEIFEKLMRKVLIQPDSGESNCELLVKNCRIHPWIRRMLISLAREAKLFDFDSRWPMMPSYSMSNSRRACLVNDNPIPQGNGLDALLTVFNVNFQYLNLEQEWLEKLKRVEVLQFGRWQSSPKYHIEVDRLRIVGSQAVGFLNGLGGQKHLKYLSLRGISRINELPASILNLISLEILDLRACHDLERLPSDISSLQRLTHFDVAECYLLEGTPKGIQKLASLQVLKGFRIGSLEKTPCRLGELAKLKKLRRLSIHMGNEAAVQSGELKRLKDISSLRRLKISWGAVSGDLEKKVSKELLFPPDLEKLDLQGFPLQEVPEGLKPSNLKKLKKLYIMGGNLLSLDHMHDKNNEQWKVEILRLKFLIKLSTEPAKVKEIFPHVKYWTMDTKAKS